jgi:hypothetical protein
MLVAFGSSEAYYYPILKRRNDEISIARKPQNFTNRRITKHARGELMMWSVHHTDATLTAGVTSPGGMKITIYRRDTRTCSLPGYLPPLSKWHRALFMALCHRNYSAYGESAARNKLAHSPRKFRFLLLPSSQRSVLEGCIFRVQYG